jgi:hypothetical protein
MMSPPGAGKTRTPGRHPFPYIGIDIFRAGPYLGICIHTVISVHWVVWVVPFCQGRGFKLGGRGMWVTEPHFAVERISSRLAVGCGPCLNETSPRVATTPPRGSYQFLCLPRPTGQATYRPRRISTRLTGRGSLCAILADPQTNARAGRNPSLKILPTIPHASDRSRRTTAPDGSPSCGRPWPAQPRSSRPSSDAARRGAGHDRHHYPARVTGRHPADRQG